ncbi:MAG TPA: hypothetical protein VMR95_03705 [Candidatus Binatia bacterium]|nr:hypothetical protein [Candidatus Binatia bacterium]
MEPQQPGQTISPQSQDKTSEVKTSGQPNSQPNENIEPERPFQAAEDSIGPVNAQSSTKSSQKDSISWTASEFVEHKKSSSWYLGLIIAGAAFASLIFFTTHDKISTGIVILVVIVMGIVATRKPRTMEYTLDDAGLTVGSKFYGYENFKSFSVVDEGAISSIYLLPLKRFMPAVSIYYDNKDEDKIVGTFSERLPLEHHKLDPVDNFMNRIRF